MTNIGPGRRKGGIFVILTNNSQIIRAVIPTTKGAITSIEVSFFQSFVPRTSLEDGVSATGIRVGCGKDLVIIYNI
jgi:hypothetical protein